MTLTLDLTSEVVQAFTEAATRQGRSREERVTTSADSNL